MTTELTHKERGDLLFKEMAAAKLNHDLKQAYFLIGAIDEVAEMVSAGHSHRTSRNYRALRALHCVNYEEMSNETRRALPLMVQHLVEPWVGNLEFSNSTNRYGIPLFKTNYLASVDTEVAAVQSDSAPRKTLFKRIQSLFEV